MPLMLIRNMRFWNLLDSLKQSGGPNWELPLGRRDSKTASLSGSNKNIPPPNATIENLVTFFKRQGLDEVDLVALSGGTSTSISCHAMLNGIYFLVMNELHILTFLFYLM